MQHAEPDYRTICAKAELPLGLRSQIKQSTMGNNGLIE
jgi:hypothetical protein